MAMSIVTNVNSLIAQENLRVNNEFQSRTIQRLTSGYRINSAGDDAAGLAVANQFRSDVSELQQGVRNANDGISTLQIIDGGLNNISKMLDRLKTLATQSASATFTGNRTTLNDEYQKLLTEINRQADNIGLGSGVVGGRYNSSISVYVGGGGATQANSKVDIDLSGAANKVDSSGLYLAGSSIAAGGATTMANSNDLTSGTFLTGGTDTQDLTFHIAGQSSDVTVTVNGGASGITGTEVVSQLNQALNTYGISASINSANGKVQFSGATAFSINVASATGTNKIFSAADTATNTSLWTQAGQTTFAAVAATESETVSVQVGNRAASVTLDSVSGASADTAIAALNSAFKDLGVYALKNAAGTGVTLQGTVDFNVKRTHSGTATNGVFSADIATYTAAATDPAAGAGITSAAEASLLKITSAVSALGTVQGKVGTSLNKLSYAIQLAQSQISNFSAAESRIRDADVAQEAANLTKAQVMQQASLAAIAQANTAPQAVLALLRG